jgi:hypothetical protein
MHHTIHPHDPEHEADVLISRLIDDEATETDRERFDHLAAAEPTLWRQLALRQQDTRTLEVAVRDATERAVETKLPRHWLAPRRLSWTLSMSGWAAMLIVALTWIVIATGGRPLDGGHGLERAAAGLGPGLTPEDHLKRYLAAPYVLGDMQPVVIEVDEMSDGRIAVHFVRRIEEVAFLDPSVELPVDSDGSLTSDPALLRSREPEVGIID